MIQNLSVHVHKRKSQTLLIRGGKQSKEVRNKIISNLSRRGDNASEKRRTVVVEQLQCIYRRYIALISIRVLLCVDAGVDEAVLIIQTQLERVLHVVRHVS